MLKIKDGASQTKLFFEKKDNNLKKKKKRERERKEFWRSMLKAFKKKRVEEVFKRKEFKEVLEIKNWESLERVKEKKLKKLWSKNWKSFFWKKKKFGGRNFKKKNAWKVLNQV